LFARSGNYDGSSPIETRWGTPRSRTLNAYTFLRSSSSRPQETPWYLAKVSEMTGDEGGQESEERAIRDAFARALSRALARVERRLAAIESDLAKAAIAREVAERARLFVASAASAPRGTTVLVAVDWATGSPEPIEMALDPSKGASEQVAALFRRARRLTAGTTAGQQRLRATQAAAKGLRELALALADPEAGVASLEGRALALAPRDYSRAAKANPAPAGPRAKLRARPPFRKFMGAGGKAILVGRDAVRNDELTLHVARPRDLWLHVRNSSGAHVVVPLDKGASCPSDVLVQAAHLAAHFSEVRDERTVEVAYAARRFVRKPRGSAPGAVVVDREKVIILRKEDLVIRQLLDSEVEL
jgi:predicted ribosome quality control (RQC) complex YloA/Tae2 family protein